MAAVDDIKSRLDLDQIAGLLGTDRSSADAAVDDALSQLVGAMGGNASDPEAAAGMTRAALGDHLNSPVYGEQIDATAVDTADGARIVDHVFTPNQIQAFGGSGAGRGGMLQKLLPILAPIVMAYLANRMQDYLGGAASGRAGAGSASQTQQSDPFGGALGGGGQGGGLGDLLGGLLGGGGAAGGSGGLGDLLGGLLGGGQGQGAPQSQPPQSSDGPFTVPNTQPQTTQPQPTGTSSGPFRTGPVGDEGLRMDDTAAPPAPTGRGGGQAQAGPAGGLGDLLKDILLGGGR